MADEKLVIAVSDAFSRIVRRELEEVLDQIVEANRGSDEGICCTQDHSDANMIMADAFEEAVGREFDFDRAEDYDVWNEAWARSKRLEFKNG